MIPAWVALLGLLAVFAENAFRITRGDRAEARRNNRLAEARDSEFQRLHALLEQLRGESEPVRREMATRQLHAELTKVHRAVVGMQSSDNLNEQ